MTKAFLLTAGLALALHSALAVSDVTHNCMSTFDEPMDNSFLLGEWYEVYKWAGWLGLPASISCPHIEFTQPTAAEVDEYMAMHSSDDLPYSLSENPIKSDRHYGYYEGLLVGDKQTKFYILPPDTTWRVPDDGYEAKVYKKINEDYVLYASCALRFQEFWLLSRKMHPTDAELQAVIALIDEVKNLQEQRFCATY